jgi:peroxiredoxin
VALLIATWLSFSCIALAEQQLTKVDRELPAFELVGVDSATWDPAALLGKPWIINFWATWCPPCIEEIPAMNRAWAKLEQTGVGMLAINAGEGADAVAQFLDDIPIDFPTLLGDGNTLPNWSVKALPTTIVIDSKGKVVFEALGPREWDDDALLQNVIGLL